MWHTWSDLGLLITLGGAIVVPLVLEMRYRSCYYIIMLAAVLVLSGVTKTAYHQPRPFWVAPDVAIYSSCSTQFGNPSGHSLSAMAFALAIWLDYNYCCSTGGVPEGSLQQKVWCRAFLFLVVFVFAGSIGWSRFVLGAHTMNQIVLGLLFGAWLAVSMHVIFYERLFDHLKRLTYGKYFILDRTGKFRMVTIITWSLFVLVMFLQIAVVYISQVGYTT